MIRNAVEDITEVRLGIDAVEFGGADQRVDDLGTHATGIGAEEQEVFAAEGNHAQRSFCSVVLEFETAVVQVAGQRGPTRQGVADGDRERRLTRQLGDGVLEPAMQILEQGPGPSLADRSSLLGAAAADLGLDGEQSLNPRERLACGRGVAGEVEVIERPANMRLMPSTR